MALKLRWHLTALVIASVVPGVIFVVVVLGRLQREERARFEQELIQVTRALTVTIDRELLGVTTTLQAVAGSPSLDAGHLPSFQGRASELLDVHPGWSDVVLIDPAAVQIVAGLRHPIGTAPMPAEAAEAVRQVVAQRRPTISNGFVARDSGRLVVALLVPMPREGTVRHVLGVYYEPAALMTLVRDHDIPQLWAVGIVDRNNVTIARSRGVEFVGKPANPRFIAMAPAAGVASIQLPTLEGVPAYGGVSRSPLTGWLIGVSRSGHPIEASIGRSTWTLAGVGAAILLVGLLLATFLASRITRPMVALSEASPAPTEAGLEALKRSGVTEVARLARAVIEAEREHDAALRREARAETENLRNELAHVGRVSLMGELSASLAHELNQPLTGISTNAQATRRMLDGGEVSRPDVRAALDDIVADCRRASEIIRRLRALFRNEVSERRPTDINEVITGVAELVQGQVHLHGITLTLELAPSLPPIEADTIQIQQVVLNLLANACEALAATDGGPRELRVTTARAAPAEVQIAVRDTGVGLKEGDVERIFAPFVSSKADGLGMGLAICRTIVEAHDGRIWAEPNGGRGLVVNVLLPAGPGQDVAARAG